MADRNKTNGYPLPAVIEVEGRKCIQFEVPDDQKYIAAALGAVTSLGRWFVWEKTGIGDRRATEAATFIRGILAETLTVKDNCDEGGEELAYTMEMVDCSIVLKADGVIVSTIDLTDPDLIACLPEGPAGPPGPPGADGADGADPITENADEIPAPPLTPGTDSRCGIANAVAQAVRDVYYLPLLEEYILQTVTNGQSHLDFMRYLQTQFGFIGLAFSYMPGLLAWVNMMEATYDVDIYNNTASASFLDAIQCHLYCAMVELDADEITAEVRALWIENVWGDTAQNHRAIEGFAQYLEQFTLLGMRTEALYAQAAAPGECDDCGCADLCAPVYINWNTTEATPTGWATMTALPAGLVNDTAMSSSEFNAVIATNPTLTCSRGSNQPWSATKSGSSGIGIRYDYPEVCVLAEAEYSFEIPGNTNSKRIWVIVQYPDDTYHLIYNFLDTAPAPGVIGANFAVDMLEVKAILFVGFGGSAGNNTFQWDINGWNNL